MYIDAHVVYIHTYVHTPAHTRSLSFSLSLAISLSLSLSHSLSLSRYLSLSPLRARALSLFLSPSFSFPALFSFFFCRYTFPLARKYMVCKSNGSSVQVCVCCRLSLFVGCCWLLFIVCWCLLLFVVIVVVVGVVVVVVVVVIVVAGFVDGARLRAGKFECTPLAHSLAHSLARTLSVSR